MNSINIEGNSGCLLNIMELVNGCYIIRKQTYDKGYIKRLRNQANKQKTLKELLSSVSSYYTIPKIYKEYFDKQLYYFDMEYFQSLDAISYFENLELPCLDVFINKIIDLIEILIKNSKHEIVDKQLFICKLQDVKSKVKNTFFVHYIDNIIQELESIKNDILLPLGFCHGDLTFSNVLIQNDDIILIDFLDNFIETPLQDIVKVRQDTKHLWTLNLFKKKYDKTKIKIIFNYIDTRLDKYFQKYAFYNNYYLLMQKINLLRIVPYARDDKIVEYLKFELKKLNGGKSDE